MTAQDGGAFLRPANAQHEPAYPGTVRVSFRDVADDPWVAHAALERCALDYPHRMSECREFEGRA